MKEKSQLHRQYSSGLLCPAKPGCEVWVELNPVHPEAGGRLRINPNHVLYDEFGEPTGMTKMGFFTSDIKLTLLKEVGPKRLYSIVISRHMPGDAVLHEERKDLRLVLAGPPFRVLLLLLDQELHITGIIHMHEVYPGAVQGENDKMMPRTTSDIDTVPIPD